jgi:hypothetical protein
MLGRFRNGNIDVFQSFGGGLIPYAHVADAAANNRKNGYDLALSPPSYQVRGIQSVLLRLWRGEVISAATGEPTMTDAALQGTWAGVLRLADTLTFDKIDSLHHATAEYWREAGLQGTWADTATTITATVAREAMITAVTMGASQALTAARAGTQAARGTSIVSRAINATATAAAGTGRAATATRTALQAVGYASRAYEGVNMVSDLHDGMRALREGDPWGWLLVAGAGLQGVAAALHGYGAARRALGATVEAEETLAKTRRNVAKIGKACGCGNCFVAGTGVATARGRVPIEEIVVGDRVVTAQTGAASTGNGVGARVRTVKLELERSIMITLVRPPEWFAEHQVAVGRTLRIDLPEMGVDGDATVTAVGRVRDHEGDGVVTGTFHFARGRPVDLTLESGETLGVTLLHPVWSVDRERFDPVWSLRPGDRVVLLDREDTVASLRLREREEPVYNLEIAGDHVYRVGAGGLLVHNASLLCDATKSMERLKEEADRIKHSKVHVEARVEKGRFMRNTKHAPVKRMNERIPRPGSGQEFHLDHRVPHTAYAEAAKHPHAPGIVKAGVNWYEWETATRNTTLGATIDKEAADYVRQLVAMKNPPPWEHVADILLWALGTHKSII